ncbi:MAG: polymer-forming cytoskeletal protein [Desulfurobacteriaceae bacterium]
MLRKKEENNTEIKSILAQGLKIEGNLKSEGKIRIDGEVLGDVTGDTIIFGSTAVVKGKVQASKVVLMGKLEGDLKADSVEIMSTAKVKGEVLAKELSIEKGASVEGTFKCGDYLMGEERSSLTSTTEE